MTTIVNPVEPIVDSTGRMKQQFQRFINEVPNQAILVGTGSPEGVIEALIARLYMDDSGTTGTILYIKKLADIGGDRSQGWILV